MRVFQCNPLSKKKEKNPWTFRLKCSKLRGVHEYLTVLKGVFGKNAEGIGSIRHRNRRKSKGILVFQGKPQSKTKLLRTLD